MMSSKIWKTQNFKFFFGILFIIVLFILWKSDSDIIPTSVSSDNISLTEVNNNSSSNKPTIVVVIKTEDQLENFSLAQRTMACYCKIYGYNYIQIIMDKSPEWQKLCPQNHIWFQRICVPLRILEQNPDMKYLLFFDADIGVINPKHRLEEYIDPKYDLSFYERMLNYDVMSASFIIKNTEFSRKFLQDWLDLEPKFRKNYGDNDQAAIHQLFLNRYYPNHPRKEKCEKIWANTTTLDEHPLFVGCARSIMNDTKEFENKIIIYPKGSKKVWVRDIWTIASAWAPRDFFFHDFDTDKITNEPKRAVYYFQNPFLSDAMFHSIYCTSFPDGLKSWKYNSTFIQTDEIIDPIINRTVQEVRGRYLQYIATL